MNAKSRTIRGAALALAVASQAPFAQAGYPDFDYETGNLEDIWDGVNAMEAAAIRMSGNYGTYLSVYDAGDYYHTANPLSFGNSVGVEVNVSGGWTWDVGIGFDFSVKNAPGAHVNGGISEGQAGSISYDFQFSGEVNLGNVQYDIGWVYDNYWVTDTVTGSATHGQSPDFFSGDMEEVDVLVAAWC